jgi:hypothetical protein
MQRLSAPIRGYSNTLRVSRPLKNLVSRISFFGSANTGRTVDEKRPKAEAEFTAVESTDVGPRRCCQPFPHRDIQTSAAYAAFGFLERLADGRMALRPVSPRA